MLSSIKRRCACAAMVSTMVACSHAQAQSAPVSVPDATPSPMASIADQNGPLLVRTQRDSLRLVERASRIVELPDNITHVTDFDPNVVTVDPISPTTVRVLALEPGVTTIVFTDVHGIGRSLEVFVAGDTRHLEAHLEYLFPDASIKAFQVGQNVVLRGFVSRPSQITEIVDVAREFYPDVHNQLQVSTNDRVVLHAKVAEVNRSRLRQFGVNFSGVGVDGIFTNATGGIGPAAAVAGGGPFFQLAEGVLQNANLAFAFRAGGNEYGAFVEALKQEAILRILAEPSVTTTSGRPATLLSGGEFPILVPQGLGQTAIEFREFGISIEAVCVVLGDGRVRLDISPEVSDLDFTNGVTLDGIRIPGLTTRRVNTQAEMRFGETLVLGGLISKRRIGSTSKVPYLGEIPIVGAAFSRKRYEEAETELLIMVTPVPAAPFGADECPPLGPGEKSSDPTDCELYWNGMLELPKYGERCGPDGCPTPVTTIENGMIVPQGCQPQYGSEPVMPVPATAVEPPMPEAMEYPSAPPAVPAVPVDVPALETPVTNTPTGNTPAHPTAHFNQPTKTEVVKIGEIRPTSTAAQTMRIQRVEHRDVGSASPEVRLATGPVPGSRLFNPFSNQKSENTLNAPAPSAPVNGSKPAMSSSPTTTSGLITPSSF